MFQTNQPKATSDLCTRTHSNFVNGKINVFCQISNTENRNVDFLTQKSSFDQKFRFQHNIQSITFERDDLIYFSLFHFTNGACENAYVCEDVFFYAVSECKALWVIKMCFLTRVTPHHLFPK